MRVKEREWKVSSQAYPEDPIDWDKEVRHVDEETHEEVVYEFEHIPGDNADLPTFDFTQYFSCPTVCLLLKSIAPSIDVSWLMVLFSGLST